MVEWLQKKCKIMGFLLLLVMGSCGQQSAEKEEQWQRIEDFFSPPEAYMSELGSYRSPLNFYNGDTVQSAADGPARRSESVERGHGMMRQWAEVLTDQELEIVDSNQRNGYMEYRVRFRWVPDGLTQGYLRGPETARGKPAMVTVFYDAKAAIGE